MHMTFEKIEPPEHPAFRAARMIREMHVETIQRIDNGTIFSKMVDGVLVDRSSEMRAECAEQIAKCDELMERARNADPKDWSPAPIMLEELVEQKIVSDSVGAVMAGIVPRGA